MSFLHTEFTHWLPWQLTAAATSPYNEQRDEKEAMTDRQTQKSTFC